MRLPSSPPQGSGRILGGSLTLITAFLTVGPLVSLARMGLHQGSSEVLAHLSPLNLPLLLGQVFLLAAGATLTALLLGVPLAWLVVRTDLPARPLFRWLAPLPLAIPPYIGALVYQILLPPGGAVPLHTLPGAAGILGLFTYPYVYLLTSSTLERTNPALEEAARIAGKGPWSTFFTLTLPLLRPALLAGSLMVFLYGWADFGVVSLLRVRTLTTLIYTYLRGTMDWSTPAGLSLLLVSITFLVLLLQITLLGRAGYTQITGTSRTPREVPLGAWKGPALLYTLGVLTLSLFLPLGVLGFHVAKVGMKETGRFLLDQIPYLSNSLWTAAAGATTALLLAFLVSWLQERRGRGWQTSTLFQIGYAIPGTVLGLGMVDFFHTLLPVLYATPLIVVTGYMVLYTTPAFQTVKAVLSQFPPSLEEAARGLGSRPSRIFWTVTLPLLRPGLTGGWILVFILSMRELAATLVLRPPGFDTLPVRLWIQTIDVGPGPEAALLALLLVGTTTLPWLFLSSRHPVSGVQG